MKGPFRAPMRYPRRTPLHGGWIFKYHYRKTIAMIDKLWPAKPYHTYMWNRGAYA